jgi:hypothetical protein
MAAAEVRRVLRCIASRLVVWDSYGSTNTRLWDQALAVLPYIRSGSCRIPLQNGPGLWHTNAVFHFATRFANGRISNGPTWEGLGLQEIVHEEHPGHFRVEPLDMC